MSSQETAYGEDDLDFSGIDPEELEEFHRREEQRGGYEGTSSGSVTRPLVISNIHLDPRGRKDSSGGRGKSVLRRSPSLSFTSAGSEEEGERRGESFSKAAKRGRSPSVSFTTTDSEEEESRGEASSRAAKTGRVGAPDEEYQARERALVSAVSASIRADMKADMRALLEEQAASQKPTVDQDEWNQMRLLQRSNAIASQAAYLTSEGAKAQFQAFAKVKANVEDARLKAQAGDGDAVLAALDRLEEIADIRLELIQRADNTNSGWTAATIFERLAQSGGSNKSKFDRLWKAAVGEAEAKKEKTADSKKTSFKSSFKSTYARGGGGGGQRGNYSFRGNHQQRRGACYSCGSSSHFASDPGCPLKSLRGSLQPRRAQYNPHGGAVVPRNPGDVQSQQ